MSVFMLCITYRVREATMKDFYATYSTINTFIALGLLDEIRNADISDTTKYNIRTMVNDFSRNKETSEGYALNALNRLRLIEAKWLNSHSYDLRDMSKLLGKGHINMANGYKIMAMNFDSKVPIDKKGIGQCVPAGDG